MTPAVARSGRSRASWAWIGLALLVVAFVAAWLLLPVRDWVFVFERWIAGLGVWGVALFALVYVLATITLAPEWPLTILAGLIYGAWGFPITLVTATLAATAAFLIARHFARRRVRALIERRRIFAAIDAAIAEDGWKIVALLRLNPAVPFNLQNYLFGVTAISTRDFVAATFAGIVPGTALYIYLGALGKAAAGGGDALKWLLFGVGLLAMAGAAVLVARKSAARLRRAGIRS